MGILSAFQRGGRGHVVELQATVKSLQAEVAELQHSVLDGKPPQTGTETNPYPTYESQVTALARKYEGQDDFGNHQVANIVDIRSAFILGQGVNAAAAEDTEDATKELEFLREFMRENNIDTKAQQWSREAELEGKFLCRLRWDASLGKAGQVRVQWIPWIQHRYEVATPADDYSRYTGVAYKVDTTGDEVKLSPGQFVYGIFGGRSHKVNKTSPVCARVLRLCESLDKALCDWRKINYLHASPTPYFKTEDDAGADSTKARLKKMNWKIGKWLAGTADFKLVGMSGEGVQSIREEITALAKMISGAVAVPVHFLGLPDLMSNRATADNLFELVVAGTVNSRQLWKDVFTQIFRYVLAMANQNRPGQTPFDPFAVAATIPETSSAKLKELTEVWLPLYEASAIDIDTLLAKIPEIDPETVKANLKQQKADALKETIATMRAESANNEPPADGSGGTTAQRDRAAGAAA